MKHQQRYVVHKDLQKVNHLLYLDAIKLYAKSRPELESLLHSVEIFSILISAWLLALRNVKHCLWLGESLLMALTSHY